MTLENDELGEYGRNLLREEVLKITKELHSKESEVKQSENIKKNAEEYEKLQNAFHEKNKELLSNTENLIGTGNLKVFSKSFDVDPIVASRAIVTLSEDFDKEDIQEYFVKLKQNKEYDKFDGSKYMNENGDAKLSKDLYKDLYKYVSEKKANEQKMTEEKSDSRLDSEEKEDKPAKFNSNVQPEAMNSRGVQTGKIRNLTERNRASFYSQCRNIANDILNKYYDERE